jgi:hypothetical protein
MHPEFIGRGHRVLMLERLIRRMMENDGVRFSTMSDYAVRWQGENPIGTWAKDNPLRVGKGSIATIR